jgi:hypothetical protein
MHFLDDFYDVLFKPKTAFARLSQRTNIWVGLLVYLVVVLVANLSSIDVISSSQLALEMEQLGFTVSPAIFESINRIAPLINAVSVLTFGPLVFLARAAFLSLSAALLGGKNDSRSLGLALGYAQLPSVLVAPIALLDKAIPFNIMGIASVGIYIWVLVLRSIALSSASSLSIRRSFLALLLPFLVLLLSLIIFLLFFGAFLAPFMIQIFG